MSLNIIIKSKTPSWRTTQPTLSHFPSLHKKDSKIVDATLSVKEMFSAEEKRKIDIACIYTNTLGIDMSKEEEEILLKENEDKVERVRNDSRIIKI